MRDITSRLAAALADLLESTELGDDGEFRSSFLEVLPEKPPNRRAPPGPESPFAGAFASRCWRQDESKPST